MMWLPGAIGGGHLIGGPLTARTMLRSCDERLRRAGAAKVGCDALDNLQVPDIFRL
jgi:hypothetical protein